MPSGVTSSRRIGLSADASPPGCGDARAAFRAALAAAPWQRSPGSRFVRLRSRRPRTVNGCIRWLPEVAIIPPWSPAGASHPGSPCVRGMLPRVASPCARLSRGSPRRSLVGRGRHAVAGRCKMWECVHIPSCRRERAGAPGGRNRACRRSPTPCAGTASRARWRSRRPLAETTGRGPFWPKRRKRPRSTSGSASAAPR